MTSDHERHADDVAPYSLGALNELEAAAFERHLMRCDTCARELAALRPVVDVLPESAPPHRAPETLKQSVMDAVAAEPRAGTAPSPAPRRRRSLRGLMPRRPALVMAGGLAALALAVGGFALGLSAGDGSAEVVAASVDRTQLPDAEAHLVAGDDVGVLRADGLPLAEDRVYVVWVDHGDGPVFESSFNAQPDGSAEAGIGDLDGVERVMVTREPHTGVAHPTESPIVTVSLG